MTSCVRFSAVLLFVFAIAFFATACGGGGGDATSASYFVPPAPSPTEPVPEPTVDPTPDPVPAYENPFKGANVGDMVKFGRYPQTATGDVQDIEWRVLAVEGDKVLAISRYGLDVKPFDDDSNKWWNSEIRGWLNGEFYDGSFNDDEKGIISSSNPGKVFLLSKDEAVEYFSSDEDRKCAPTKYAEKNGALEQYGCCYWWLRSPAPDSYFGSLVSYDGDVDCFGNVDNDSGSVRPALWINLSPEPAYENPFKGANVGDMVKFGRYPQTATGDVQDIEWRVLAVEGDKVLAISRYGLDAKRFDDNSNKWWNSEIRGWLNGEFYNSSFNDDEKGIIASSDPGKVFLLSKDEVYGYFSSDEDRKCVPTEYARANGAYVYEGYCCWWLRSPHPDDSDFVCCVKYDGDADDKYRSVDSNSGSVRPALWINLSPEPAYENPFKGANVGDTVKFGRYPQTAAGDVQDIEWRVLAVDGDKVLAISRYGLDAKRFDYDSNVWENSDICVWLNGEFYEGSFYDAEKGIIASSDPGKVFLLSKKEAEEYFDSDEERKCAPTEYAKKNGAGVSFGCCCWWLRSLNPDDSSIVYRVDYDGDISDSRVSFSGGSARPALWINLESE